MHWFDGWDALLQVVVFAPIVYVFLIASHRLVGKRAASKMNNFDWIVTVAIGAITGTTVLSEGVSLVEGLAAVAILLGFQSAVTWAAARWRPFRQVVYAQPCLLFYEGVYLHDAMNRERINRNEIDAAAREGGHRSIDEVAAVVLEANGSLSVLPAPDGEATGLSTPPLLNDVKGLPAFAPDGDA